MNDARAAFELGRDGATWIIAGVDGSQTSERAGAYAAGLARRQGSKLAIVLAQDLRTASTLGSEAAVNAAIESSHALEQDLREAITATPWPVEVELIVRPGAPFQVLSEVADELSAGLIVLGSSRPHAYLRPSGALSAQLIRARRWPVLVVP